jgi:hypothetical protein
MEVELDPSDAASVERFYMTKLSFDLLRREFADAEFSDAAMAVASDSQRIVDTLEEANWDISGVDVEPSEAAARAARDLDSYQTANCG